MSAIGGSPKRRRSLFARPRSPPKPLLTERRATLSEDLTPDSSFQVWRVPEILPPPPKIFVQPPTPVSTIWSLSLTQTEKDFQQSIHLKPPSRDIDRTQLEGHDSERPPASIPVSIWPPRVSSHRNAQRHSQAEEVQFQPKATRQYTSSLPAIRSLQQDQKQQPFDVTHAKQFSSSQPLPPPPTNPTIDDVRRLKYDIWTLVTSTWDPWYDHNRFPKHILAVEAPLQHEPFRKEVYEKMLEIRQHVAELRGMLRIARRECEGWVNADTDIPSERSCKEVGGGLGDRR